MAETWQVDGPKVIESAAPSIPYGGSSSALIGGRVDVVAHDEPEGRLEVHRSPAGRSTSAGTARPSRSATRRPGGTPCWAPWPTSCAASRTR